MSEQQRFALTGGFVAACAFAVLVLFGLFYATVSGAVDRASQRHAEARDNSRLSSVAGSLPAASSRLASLSSTTR